MFDDERFFCLGTVIVKGETRKLVRQGRVESDVQQRRAVLIAAEHIECHKAGTREITLVAEDAIKFQRMADRFVDLQHHLVRHKDDIHFPGRAIGRRQ